MINEARKRVGRVRTSTKVEYLQFSTSGNSPLQRRDKTETPTNAAEVSVLLLLFSYLKEFEMELFDFTYLKPFIANLSTSNIRSTISRHSSMVINELANGSINIAWKIFFLSFSTIPRTANSCSPMFARFKVAHCGGRSPIWQG